jgi:inhibitor of KinA sporulation pathway (predicted exonuclease)
LAPRLDQVVVIDVEATCWRGPPPAGQLQEIIEVGFCLLDTATLGRHSRGTILVRPTRSIVSDFCTELTTLSPDQVAGGALFSDACEQLASLLATRERTWGSWGDFDRRLFEDQCAWEKVRSPFGTTHLNVKNLFALVRHCPAELGMMEALALAGIEHEGTHHRGGDDAWNIAGLLASILRAARG